jgi:hypothetical protein
MFDGYLKEEVITTVMNAKDGHLRKSESGCLHNVTSYKDLYFKEKPSHPLMEYAIHNLSCRLGGYLTPSHELFRFEVLVGGKTLIYPVLISQTISKESKITALLAGKEFREVVSKYGIDMRQYTWLVLTSILTRLGDGKLSNYVFSNKNGLSAISDGLKIFCVDNDSSFVEPVTSVYFSKTINLCSSLFCLFPLSTELDVGVLKEFCQLDGSKLLNDWIDDIISRDELYGQMFTTAEQKDLFVLDEKRQFVSTILFKAGALGVLHYQFLKLQHVIELKVWIVLPSISIFVSSFFVDSHFHY